MPLRRLVLLLLIVLPLTACGNKGPLVKPSAQSAAAVQTHATPAIAQPEPTGH